MSSQVWIQISIPGSGTRVVDSRAMQIDIGRQDDNDIVLLHPSVSDHHARLVVGSSGLIVLSDLRSQTGTFVDGRRLVKPTAVHLAEVLRLGACELVLLEHAPPSDVEAPFLEAIARSLADDRPRLAYADWLGGEGRTTEAELLRAQVESRRLAPGDARFFALAERIQALAPSVPAWWRRAVARPPIENCSIRFELVCPKTWDSLAATDVPTKRFCASCRKNVYYATSPAEAQRLATTGECVVVDLAAPRTAGDLARTAPAPVMGTVPPR